MKLRYKMNMEIKKEVVKLLKKLKDRGYIKISDTPLKERKIYPLFQRDHPLFSVEQF